MRYSVSELKQENRTTADCSVTIPPLPGAAVVPDQSEFITGVPSRKNRLYCVTL